MSRKFRSWNMVDGDEIRRGILNDATLAASGGTMFFSLPEGSLYQVENYGEILSEIKSV